MVAASATSTRGERHRQDELAQRQVPRLLQHLGLDLEPVAEQDQDQRDTARPWTKSDVRVEVEHLEAALAEHEPGHHEQRR